MRCEVHPEYDAVGVCISCGRGACPDCKVIFQGALHCKSCIESGRILSNAPVQPPAQAQKLYVAPPDYIHGLWSSPPGGFIAKPLPAGEPSGAFFKIGFVGAVLSGVAILFNALFYYTLTMDSFWGHHSNPVIFAFFCGTALLTGAVITTVGFFGFYRNYGSLSSLIFSSIFLGCIAGFVVIMPLSIDNYNMNFQIAYPALLVLGIGLTMCGVGVSVVKKFMRNKNITDGASGFFLGGGLLFCVYLGLFFVGWIFTAMGFFMLAAVFATAPVPFGEQYRVKTIENPR